MTLWLVRWLLLPLVIGLMWTVYLVALPLMSLGQLIEERLFCPLEDWVQRRRRNDGE